MNTKKIFTGGINQDDAHILLKENEYLNALNIRVVTAADGKVGFVSTIEGNTAKPLTLPEGVNETIGVCEDSRKLRVYFFNKNSLGNHGIYCYDSPTNTAFSVLDNADVTGGLNFTKYITSASVIGDLLYWTDGVNPPRRVNVEAAIKMNYTGYVTTVAPYVAPLAQSVITLVRNPPAYPLAVEKVAVQSSEYPNNFVKDEAFQFAYRFVYRDGEVSTFSHWSRIINFNSNKETTDSKRAIDVAVPSAQEIPQDVKTIEVAVRYYLDGRMFIIKRFSDFTGSLTFRFFNDFIGIAVDDAVAIKQFDPVPLKSEALEIARDRVFLANNTEGYDTPTQTSLSKTIVTSSSTVTNTTNGTWYKLEFRPWTSQDIYTVYVLDIPGLADKGYYRENPLTTVEPTSVTESLVGKVYVGETFDSLMLYIDAVYGPSEVLYFSNFLDVTVTNVPSGQILGLNGVTGFKSAAFYRMGVVFYDEAGRKSGVVTNDDLRFITPDRGYAITSYTTGVSWSLVNDLDPQVMQAEIPAWAKYYSIVMTKCLRTSFFMQMMANSFKYVSKNSTTGEYTEEASYSATHFGCLISIKSLFSVGYGYTYQEGDIIKLYPNTGSPVSLNIKDTWGEYVVCDLTNLTGVTYVLYEIYTPLFSTFDDVYYERGEVYRILNPGQTNRSYAVTGGVIEGDIYLLQRLRGSDPYIVEAMSPNDFKWKNWNPNTGRTNVVTTSGQTQKPNSIRFSGVILLGTQTNGLSTFELLDEESVPYEMGPIYRLVLTSKTQNEGTVMLAIGKHETASIYLGETRVFDNSGSSFLAKSSGVIGTVNVLKGSYGTINPESVVEWMGAVYWFDANKGAVVRYDSNGLFPISSYKMTKYFRKVGADALSGKPVLGGFDPYHGEFLIMSPMGTPYPQAELLSDIEYNTTNFIYSEETALDISALNPGGVYKCSPSGGRTDMLYKNVVLPNNAFFYDGDTKTVTAFPADYGVFNVDITEIERNLYEGYDGVGGVHAFQPMIDRWTSMYSFRPEYMSMVANRLVTFKGGVPYVHDSQTANRFYGVQYDSAVALVHTEAQNVTKKYYALFVEGDTPNVVHVRTEVPNIQSSDLRSGTYDPRTGINGDFTIKEGVSYAPVLRDRLSPNTSGTYDQKLTAGDDIAGEVGLFTIIYKKPTTRKTLKLFNIGFILSRGHTIE